MLPGIVKGTFIASGNFRICAVAARFHSDATLSTALYSSEIHPWQSLKFISNFDKITFTFTQTKFCIKCIH